ncbi:uncharacterized protein PHACADRAFT_67636, partial [Phanerochaete carnosa HHB-10118-sp]
GIKCSRRCTYGNPVQSRSGTYRCLGSNDNQDPCDGTYNVTPEHVCAWQLYVDHKVPQLVSSNAALRQQGYTALFMKTDTEDFAADSINRA